VSTLSFFLTGHTAQDAVMEDIHAAKHSIYLEMFIIGVDDTGLRLLNALRKKAREGVKVKLLADAVGSFYLYRSPGLQEELKADGVEFSFFNHLVPWYPKNLRLWYFRNHRRTVVIDDHLCYTGSVCFSDHMREWRETMVRVSSKEVAGDMSHKFERMWRLSEHGVFGKREKMPIKDVSYLTHAPLPGRRQLYRKMLEVIREAKEEILITTPYFIPDHRLLRTLEKARKRNVRIAILVPHPSNHEYVDWAGDFDKTVCMQRGIEFYFYRGMIHSKTMVVDDKIALVGSMNMDNVSLRYNFESALLVENKHAAETLRSHFIEDINHSYPMNLAEWEQRPWQEKFLMWIMWPFRKLL
jgi:cardiolipin synthase